MTTWTEKQKELSKEIYKLQGGVLPGSRYPLYSIEDCLEILGEAILRLITKLNVYDIYDLRVEIKRVLSELYDYAEPRTRILELTLDILKREKRGNVND